MSTALTNFEFKKKVAPTVQVISDFIKGGSSMKTSFVLGVITDEPIRAKSPFLFYQFQ